MHLKRDPRISVCVEQAYRSITLTGTVTLDEDPATARANYQRLGERYRSTLNFASLAPERGGGRAPGLLSRERVTLLVQIDKVHSNGLP